MIDQTCHARVADFSLLTLVSDPGSQMSSGSHSQAGTARWMSPELIDPKRFNIDKSRRTKSSDCYAFGMVMYETMSGQLPFYEERNSLTVFTRVLYGEHPTREDVFTDDLWEVVERCWTAQPEGRPHIEDILRYLEGLSPPSEPPSEMPSPEISGAVGDSFGTFQCFSRKWCLIVSLLRTHRNSTANWMGFILSWILELCRSLRSQDMLHLWSGGA